MPLDGGIKSFSAFAEDSLLQELVSRPFSPVSLDFVSSLH